MALITRISRLFRADFHAVLDRLEEPDILLRQAVREMEEELAREERQMKGMEQERVRLGKRREELDGNLARIEEQLDLCIESGKDDLARALVRRKLESEKLVRALAENRRALDEALTERKARLEENRSRLADLQQKLEVFSEESPSAPSDNAWPPAGRVSDADVEVALMQAKAARSRS